MIEEILPNLFVVYSPNEGANCYLLIGKKATMIDTSLGKNSDYVRDAFKQVPAKETDIEMILHTHGHIDHFGSDFIFPDAEKFMHAHDAQRINLKDAMFSCASFFGEENFPEIKKFLKDGMEIKNEPFLLKVIEAPGHTKGSVCFYEEKNKLLFSGDCIFRLGVGRYDLPSSSKQQMVASLKKLMKLDYKLLLPGHGLILKDHQKENVEDALSIVEESVDLGEV